MSKEGLLALMEGVPQWISAEGIGEIISVFAGGYNRVSHAYHFIAGSYDTDASVDILHNDLKRRSGIELKKEGVEEYSLSILHLPNTKGVMVIVSTVPVGKEQRDILKHWS